MRFTINREEFLKGLLTVSRAINSKNPIAALTNIKLDLNDNGLFITGSNRDLTIRVLVPYLIEEKEIIRNYQHGSVLLNLKAIEFCREVKTEEINVEVQDDTIAILSSSNGNNELTLQCIKVEEYYDVDLEPDNVVITLTGKSFHEMVNQTAFAASVKEQRLILTALNLDASNGLLTVNATDSSRMAKKEIVIPDNINFVANIPAKMMVEVDHLLENQEYINISIGDKKALFSFDRIVVATTLVAGEYPNVRNVVPHNIKYVLQVNAQETLSAIKLANLVTERENVVDLSMGPDGVQISAKSGQTGSGVNKIDSYKYEGAEFRISFNSEYVSSAIRALGSEDIEFQFVEEIKAFIIKNPNDNSIVQIVTPMRPYY